MSDLISRSKVISVLEQLEEHSLTGKMDISNAIYLLNNAPTAYDIDKVVEELEEAKHEICLFDDDLEHYQNGIDDAIEIVKQVGGNNRKDCEYRHDNGNCLKVGGFCTAVDNKHCEKLKQGGVADDVCEWKVKSNYYVTKCSHDTDIMYGLKQDFKFCPYCSKKIKIVGD